VLHVVSRDHSSCSAAWNEYFFAALLTSTDAKTLPVMVASQAGSQGINWWSMAALSTAAIALLVPVSASSSSATSSAA
jgi:ABC-type glycerol-3-phosphate transport system permease component